MNNKEKSGTVFDPNNNPIVELSTKHSYFTKKANIKENTKNSAYNPSDLIKLLNNNLENNNTNEGDKDN